MAANNRYLNPKLINELNKMSQEAREIWLGRNIQETFEIPSAIEFLRSNVSKNLPLVIRDGLKEWPAVQKWNSLYLKNLIGQKKLTIAVTPNGYADGISSCGNHDYFVMPEESTMSFNEFIDILDERSGLVHYIQKQNSNMTEDFTELIDDLDEGLLDFARVAFNKEPDAINFWMGDSRAITSMHVDPYENIYCVISGYKDFILIPPSDVHCVPRETYQTAIFETCGDGIMQIKPLFDDCDKPLQIEWVSIDPLAPDLEKFPNYKQANVFHVRVNAGDVLYLPSLWYHHVRQSHKCIAVNYWYDMDYDMRYCTHKMVRRLCGFKVDE